MAAVINVGRYAIVAERDEEAADLEEIQRLDILRRWHDCLSFREGNVTLVNWRNIFVILSPEELLVSNVHVVGQGY